MNLLFYSMYIKLKVVMPNGCTFLGYVLIYLQIDIFFNIFSLKRGDKRMALAKPIEKKLETYQFIAFAAALISTLGSLYFSEVLKYVPCELCWYQRIFMYPQVIIIAIAAAKKDYSNSLYTFVLSVIGGLIAFYHYLVQKVTFIGENSISCGIVPCNSAYINWLGFITIPFLALIGFTIIGVCSFLMMKQLKEGK